MPVGYSILTRVRHKGTPDALAVFYKEHRYDEDTDRVVVRSTMVHGDEFRFSSPNNAAVVAKRCNENLGPGADPWRVHAVS